MWLDFGNLDTDDKIYEVLTVMQIVELALLWEDMKLKRVWVN
jgi:hypothetical protein